MAMIRRCAESETMRRADSDERVVLVLRQTRFSSVLRFDRKNRASLHVCVRLSLSPGLASSGLNHRARYSLRESNESSDPTNEAYPSGRTSTSDGLAPKVSWKVCSEPAAARMLTVRRIAFHGERDFCTTRCMASASRRLVQSSVKPSMSNARKSLSATDDWIALPSLPTTSTCRFGTRSPARRLPDVYFETESGLSR